MKEILTPLLGFIVIPRAACPEFLHLVDTSGHGVPVDTSGHGVPVDEVGGRSGYFARGKAERPAYTAASPSSSSMRSNWLYFATLSLRAGAPVLI